MKTNFLRHFFTAVLLAATTLANAANVNVTTSITASTTWTNNNTYILFGDIIVKNGATLTIEKGTLVKGNKTTLTPNPKPLTPNPKPQTPNPKPQTPNPVFLLRVCYLKS
jgi:hypothetical protein